MFVDGARPLSTRRLTACDEYLTGAATELLDHDDRLRDIAVDVRFDRGVAHLTGAVADPGQLRLVRELIGRLGGVLAVWSRVRVAGREPVIVDFLPLVDECHRVLRPDGMLHVLSPWWRFANAVADPTHVRLLDIQTVKGICDRWDGAPRWYPVHAGCDGASVFADLAPRADGAPGPPPGHLARFFDCRLGCGAPPSSQRSACSIQCCFSSCAVRSTNRFWLTGSALSVAAMRWRIRSMLPSCRLTNVSTTASSPCHPAGICGRAVLSASVRGRPSGGYPIAEARSATRSAPLRAASTISSRCRCSGRKRGPTTVQCACLPSRARPIRSTSASWSTSPVTF